MSAKSRSDPKLEYFCSGIEALRQLGADMPLSYACPLCLRLFEESNIGALSREHVPPQGVGGKRLVLTCRECNQTAGSRLDAQAKKAEDLREFGEGRLDKPLFARVRFHDAGLEQNVEVKHSNGEVAIAGLPRGNPPDTAEKVKAILDQQVNKGAGIPPFSLSLVGNSFSRRRVAISWLRAGYLASFACLGYRYILRHLLEGVRDQIRQPDENIIDGFYHVLPASNTDQKAVVLVTHPDWARGLAVQFGRHLVLLPFLDGDCGYYAVLARKISEGVSASFKGKSFDWPLQPTFHLDHATPAERMAYVNLVSGESL